MKLRRIPFSLAPLLMLFALSGFAVGKELKSIGLTVGDLANPFFVAMSKGTEDAARKINPNAKVTTLSTKHDLNTQVNQVETFISNKIDLLLIDAVDPQAISPIPKKARDAGIVVVAIGVELAIKQAKRKGGFITSVDDAPDAEFALKNTARLLEGNSAQNPHAMANEGVRAGYAS